MLAVLCGLFCLRLNVNGSHSKSVDLLFYVSEVSSALEWIRSGGDQPSSCSEANITRNSSSLPWCIRNDPVEHV